MFHFDVSWVFKVKNKCSLPVWIVEENLLQDGEGGQLHQGPVKGGQLWATRVSSPAHQVVNNHRHGPGDYHMVEEDTLQGLAQLSWIHLEDKWRGQKRYQNYSNYQASLSTDKCNLHGMTLRSFERHFLFYKERKASLFKRTTNNKVRPVLSICIYIMHI